eukprot:CAMPEP_0205911988 /NCGR_PEP_ID=MMETSP1325-20131115/5520_1 /ASSEMBLY_ACC=CAM_ASM_000708 /TAXON_ID=236786 /ORGANISM="Florenciella sp., Strain RCC1007" /LENGTH=118 /DNA_ID=CAMNT_0053278597 /DNA_START=314 /DNA_END=666 /DNA_ORIENTATION=-
MHALRPVRDSNHERDEDRPAQGGEAHFAGRRERDLRRDERTRLAMQVRFLAAAVSCDISRGRQMGRAWVCRPSEIRLRPDFEAGRQRSRDGGPDGAGDGGEQGDWGGGGSGEGGGGRG